MYVGCIRTNVLLLLDCMLKIMINETFTNEVNRSKRPTRPQNFEVLGLINKKGQTYR